MDESWLVVISTILWICLIAKLASPPGPSFTGAWLFVGFQGFILQSESVLNCFYIGGAGLIFGWYGAQIVDTSVWPRILNIWIPKFPWAPRGALSAAVRGADLYLHALPFALSSQWAGKHIGWLPWLQVLIIERAYFLIIDGSFIGDGSGINEVYQIQPRADPSFFWTLQGLSFLGQVVAIINELVFYNREVDDSSLLATTGAAGIWRLQEVELCRTPAMLYAVCAVILVCMVKTHAIELAPSLLKTLSKTRGAGILKSVSSAISLQSSSLRNVLSSSLVR